MNENEGPDTLKIPKLDQINELEYVQYLYDTAVNNLLAHPTYENRQAFLAANEKLIETRYAYQKGAELITIFNTIHQTYSNLSQKLQFL